MLLTTGLATELGPRRIRVVGINPGSTLTERFERITDNQAAARGESPEEYRARLARTTPTGSIPTAADVGNLITFLASVRAAQINGTVVTIDGGLLQTL